MRLLQQMPPEPRHDGATGYGFHRHRLSFSPPSRRERIYPSTGRCYLYRSRKETTCSWMFDRFVVRWKHSRPCSSMQRWEADGNNTQSSECCHQTLCCAESRIPMPSVLYRSASVIVRTYNETKPRLFSRETKFRLVEFAGQVEVAAFRNG